jgi:hypothetical protein
VVGAGADDLQHHVFEAPDVRAESGDLEAGADQAGVKLGRVVAADEQRRAVAPFDGAADGAVEQCHRPLGIRGFDQDLPGGRAQRGQFFLKHEPAVIHDPDPGTELVDLGELVA